MRKRQDAHRGVLFADASTTARAEPWRISSVNVPYWSRASPNIGIFLWLEHSNGKWAFEAQSGDNQFAPDARQFAFWETALCSADRRYSISASRDGRIMTLLPSLAARTPSTTSVLRMISSCRFEWHLSHRGARSI